MRATIADFLYINPKHQRLTIDIYSDFRNRIDKLRDGDVELTISKWKQKRSLDANAMFHALVNQIADVRGVEDAEVKREMVLEYGTVARDEDNNILGCMLPIGTDAQQYYRYSKWYKTKTVDGKEVDCYLFFKPTHELNTKEMSKLLKGTIETAKELGIDTDTAEIKSIFNREGETWKTR